MLECLRKHTSSRGRTATATSSSLRRADADNRSSSISLSTSDHHPHRHGGSATSANPAYIASLASHVFALWFVRMPLAARAGIASYVLDMLVATTDAMGVVVPEALVLIHIVNQYTFSSRTSAFSQQLAPGVEALFCRDGVDVSERRVWLCGHTLVTLRTSPRGWVHLHVRNCVSATGWLVRPTTHNCSAASGASEDALQAWLASLDVLPRTAPQVVATAVAPSTEATPLRHDGAVATLPAPVGNQPGPVVKEVASAVVNVAPADTAAAVDLDKTLTLPPPRLETESGGMVEETAGGTTAANSTTITTSTSRAIAVPAPRMLEAAGSTDQTAGPRSTSSFHAESALQQSWAGSAMRTGSAGTVSSGAGSRPRPRQVNVGVQTMSPEALAAAATPLDEWLGRSIRTGIASETEPWNGDAVMRQSFDLSNMPSGPPTPTTPRRRAAAAIRPAAGEGSPQHGAAADWRRGPGRQQSDRRQHPQQQRVKSQQPQLEGTPRSEEAADGGRMERRCSHSASPAGARTGTTGRHAVDTADPAPALIETWTDVLPLESRAASLSEQSVRGLPTYRTQSAGVLPLSAPTPEATTPDTQANISPPKLDDRSRTIAQMRNYVATAANLDNAVFVCECGRVGVC